MHITIGSMDASGNISEMVLDAARQARSVFMQTRIGHVLCDMGIAYQTLDSLFETAEDFDALVDQACELLAQDGALFIVLGDICSNRIAAAASVRIRQCGGSVRVIPYGDAALCAAFAEGAADSTCGVAVFTASSFYQATDTGITLVVNEIDSKLLASELKLKLSKYYDDEYNVCIVDTRTNIVKNIPLCHLDAESSYGYYTSVVLPACLLEQKKRFTFLDLVSVMKRLRSPDGCPWDKEQSHKSLKRYLIEEGYEVLDAIDAGDADALCDELGDVLLQVIFHARIAQQQGSFDDTDITTAICAKMISRHTHIFGEAKADTPDAVVSNWEQIKKGEKGQRTQAEVLAGVPRSMPALMRSGKVQHKAAHVGFDFESTAQALDKLQEEIVEVVQSTDAQNLFEECGDLLFAAVNVVRLLGIEPEMALQKATDKFISRFEIVERIAQEQGLVLGECSMEKLDRLWEMAKTLC